jgi:PilZ domain
MSIHDFYEKRRTPRRLLGRLVKIQIENAKSRLCLVTDVSDGGVRIHANGFEVPENFVLLFPEDGPTLSGNYRVVWRLDQNVGAEFIGAGP